MNHEQGIRNKDRLVLALGSLLLNPKRMKHIESIQPEYAADDMTALLLSDATASAALSRLLHDWTGCAIPQTSDLPQSEVEELVPLCVSILRRHWTTPLTALGDGTTPMSLADLFHQSIGDRVQGNEAWSIPPANANLPTALAQLRDRKISGIPQAPDGISLAQLLCSSLANDSVTELVDNNRGWVMNKADYLTYLVNAFTNLKKVELHAKRIEAVQKSLTNSTIEEFSIPDTEEIVGAFCVNLPNGKINAPKLKTLTLSGYNNGWVGPLAKEMYMPSVTVINGYNRYFQYNQNMPMEKWVLGTLTSLGWSQWGWTGSETAPNLLHFEICADGGELSMNLNLNWWTATNVISNPEFLSNFKTYIAHRLKGGYAVGTGPTLTLSQAVRDAIQTDPDIVNIITSKGWTISPAPSV